MDRAAAETRFPTLAELRHTLQSFVTGHESDRDLAMRYITQRIAMLKTEVVAVLDRKADAIPEIAAGMRELRLLELRAQRGHLSREIDALDAEEKQIRLTASQVGRPLDKIA